MHMHTPNPILPRYTIHKQLKLNLPPIASPLPSPPFSTHSTNEDVRWIWPHAHLPVLDRLHKHTLLLCTSF